MCSPKQFPQKSIKKTLKVYLEKKKSVHWFLGTATYNKREKIQKF